jgi:hypothetical protein
MDSEGTTLFVKKKGRPKGRKDGPRREGAPTRGRPKKKVENEKPVHAVIHGVCSVQ